MSLNAVGFGLLDLGTQEQARPELEASLRLQRANGDRLGEASTLGGLSTVALRQGDARALSLARAAGEVAAAVQARHIEAIALTKLGCAELALGRFAPAAAASERSRALAWAIDAAIRHDATAGLARVSLAQGDLDAERTRVEELMVNLGAGGSLDGVEDPRMVEGLDRAHGHLLEQACAIDDGALRQSFLSRIPIHRSIVAALEARQRPGA